MNEKSSNELTSAVDALFSRWNRSDCPGYLVAVAQGDTLLYRRAFGLASVEHGVANTTATRMRIGSTTKQFTCLATYLLQERGMLDVDASVRTYLPELPPTTVEPTLRQLMNHTGGYRDYLDLSMLAHGLSLPKPGFMLEAAVRQTAVNFSPGERMIYNNGGYHLLSHIVERVSGLPFGDFLKANIFDPLGMVDTELVPDDMHIRPRTATCHVPLPDGGYKRGVFPSWDVLGEGGMVSTLDDMLRWLKHLRGKKCVGSPETWQQMTRRTRFASDVLGEYASGLIISRHRGEEVIHHGGTVIGGGCQVLTVPAHDLDVLLITNGSLSVDPIQLGRDLIDLFVGDAVLGAPAASLANEKDFAGLTGFYVEQSAMQVIEVMAQGGKLFAREMMGPPMSLTEIGGSLQMDPIILGPTTMHLAALDSLDVEQSGKSLRYTRIDKQQGLLAQVALLQGVYDCADLAVRATIVFDGTDLTLTMQGLDGRTFYRLDPLTSSVIRFVPADQFSIQSGILFVSSGEGPPQRFTLGDFANRRLDFVRVETIQTPVAKEVGVLNT